MICRFAPGWLLATAVIAVLLLQPQAAPAQNPRSGPAPIPTGTPVFPLGSRLGLVPPPGISSSQTFPGFEDRQNNVYVRLVAMPDKAFSELEKTLRPEVLRQQGLSMERRETFSVAGRKGILLVARQAANSVRLRKWMLVAPVNDFTALVSFEIPESAKKLYPDAAIRATLASIAARTVPLDEMLALLPFRLTDTAGLRVAQVVPGVAVQLTDGPRDTLEIDQAHVIVSAVPGGPDPRDRDKFARLALSNLPPLRDIRVTGSEPMRIAGQPGHELRAEATDPTTGNEVQIVQWLRFGVGGYMHIVGFAKKDGWTENFMRFRSVRDGIASR